MRLLTITAMCALSHTAIAEPQITEILKEIVDFCNEEKLFPDKKNIEGESSKALIKQGSLPYPPGKFSILLIYKNANHNGQALRTLDHAKWNSDENGDGIDAVIREFEASRYENARALAARLIRSGDRKGAVLYPAILSKMKPEQPIDDILFYINEMHPLQRIEILFLLNNRLNDLEFRTLLNPKDLSELAKTNRKLGVRAAKEIHLSILRRKRLRAEATQRADRPTEHMPDNSRNTNSNALTGNTKQLKQEPQTPVKEPNRVK